ncbi:MAG: ABC-F family ATP-binding cassette domain-containing protein [Anaerolineales bacterium]|nr:ABC-F family ATP-binding cassette domain-containing protein [Anaerolineales bacterium]
MISIQLSNLTLVLGARRIFENLGWEVQHDQKLGLVGPNGAGKSSLLKLITGEYSAEPGGSVTRARGVTIGYMPQNVFDSAGVGWISTLSPAYDDQAPVGQTEFQTPFAIAMGGAPRYTELQTELEQVEASLGDPDVYGHERRLGRALHAQQRLLDEYLALGGDSFPQRVTEMLLGLGLAAHEHHKPLEALSGGQKKLAVLARLLLAQPDVLLLDEPDNHLDLPGKVYLERLIRAYPGAVVIISHDRYLLDAAVTHIAEIEDGRMSTFSGSYSEYMLDKESRLLRQEELFRVQQRQVRHMEEAIKRFSIWAKVFDIEKFAARARNMQKRLDKMDKIERPTLERRRMELRLGGWRGSNKVLELRGVTRSFDGRVLFSGLDQVIWHGERVGLIGPNGSGKSALLRLVLGDEQPDTGEIILGPSVKIGYYAQEHETLDFNSTLLEAVRQQAELSESRAVAFLLRYLFTYQQITQKIGDLSGGERSRLQLALLVLSGANFLLLDEPTNNLDIASAEVLEQALEDFVGTALIISHDRYFLDRTVDRLLAFEQGSLQAYPGGYSDYLEHTGG